MSDLYVTICEKWNRLNAETEGNLRVECQLVDGRQDNSQKFAPISFDTAVGTFLTYPDNESNDVLLKVRGIFALES